MYEIKAEDTFIQDVNRWSKKVPEETVNSFV